MPALRPTADSIWTSFRSSRKRHILITGKIGSGKTTLFSKLFPETLPGITTWAEPYQSVFMQDNLTGKTQKIAEYDPSITGTNAKMVLIDNSMAAFGTAVLKDCRNSTSEWVTIDEIGFLEENCEAFKNALRDLFESKNVAAIVRKQDLPFLNELRSRQDVFLVDLDQPFGNCGCVIMASGLGKRFGENKLMADFLGRPLISSVLDITDDLFAARVVVTRHEDIADLCKERGIPFVLHALPFRSDTVRLGLEAVGRVDHCMFCPGDQPLLTKETVSSLLLSAADRPDFIWRPRCEENPGSPVVFPNWSFAELLHLPEGKGGGVVMKKHPDKVMHLEISDSWELTDADTPDILETLKRKVL